MKKQHFSSGTVCVSKNQTKFYIIMYMNYYNKYLKYKEKYIILKNNNLNKQIGGFSLNDNTKDFLKNSIISELIPYSEKFNIITDKTTPNDLDPTIELFLSTNYNSIYEKLIDKFFSDKTYIQEFKSTLYGNAMSKIPGMHDYHISFAALIFMNYLIELEISTLIYKIIKVNTDLKNDNNVLVNLRWTGIEEKDHTKTRIYRSSINNSISDKINELCTILDTLFYNFMNDFVFELHSINKKISLIDVYNCFIPFYHYEYYNTDGILQKNFFDFIYVDWKEKIRNLFRKTIPEWDQKHNAQINIILERTIKKISAKTQQYIADAIGFFSFIHMINPIDIHLQFGSCITYSAFELYIMSRLHIKSDKLNLVVEVPSDKPDKPHPYWRLTQQFSGKKVLSHWATKFTFDSYTINLRNISNYTQASMTNFETPKNKRKILQLLTYPIFDNYFEYLKQNKDKFTPEQEKKITQIKNFINKKAILIENILLTHKDAYESEDIQIIIQNIKTKWTDSFNTVGGTWNDSNVEYINLILMSVEYLKKLNLDESFIKIFNETKNIKGYTILYYYSRFGNLDIVNNIITNLTKIDLNVCNKDNSTPLHAAAWGEQNNSIEQMKNRLEIVKLLISKGADKKLVNTNKETPFKNNQNTLHTNPEIKELIKLQL